MNNKIVKTLLSFLKRREVVALIIIAAAVFAVYSPSINYPFVSDDVYRIEKNTALQNPLFFRFAYFIDKNTSADAANITLDVYRPLSTLFFSFINDFFGPNPAAYRTASLLLHCANAALIMALAHALGLNFFVAVAAAAFFALNPSSAENITNITGQSSIMACLLMLIALLLFIRHKEKPMKAVISVPVLYFCAMLFRETAIVLPGILFVFSWFLYRKRFDWRFYAVLCVPAAVFMFMRTFVLGHMSGGDLWYYNLFLHLGMFAKYLFVEAPLSMLAPFMNHPLYHAVTLGANPYMQASLILAAAGIFIFILYYCRKKINPLFFVLLAWIFVTLIPVHNIPAADRFLYFGLIPLSLIIALLADKTNKLKIPLIAVYIAVMAYACNTQARLWKSSQYFLMETMKRYSYDYIVLVNYGRNAISSGGIGEAISAYNRAIEQHPPTNQLMRILFDMGSALVFAGKLDEAQKVYDSMLEIHPGEWYTYLGLYYVAMKKGDRDTAKAMALKTVEEAKKVKRIETRAVKTTTGTNVVIIDTVIAATVVLD